MLSNSTVATDAWCRSPQRRCRWCRSCSAAEDSAPTSTASSSRWRRLAAGGSRCGTDCAAETCHLLFGAPEDGILGGPENTASMLLATSKMSKDPADGGHQHVAGSPVMLVACTKNVICPACS